MLRSQTRHPLHRQSQRLHSAKPGRRDSGISQLDENQTGVREAAYDSTVGVFSQDGTIPEDGLRLLIENFRKSMNISRPIPLTEVSGSTVLLEVQRELGIRK